MTESVLLLSGGIDSTALAYSQRPDLAITVDYGQICAEAEIQAATQVCAELNIEHTVIEVDCSELGVGSLSNDEQIDVGSTPEWWPFRNQLIITLSAMRSVQKGGEELILGTVKTDQQHADGKKEFYAMMDSLLSFQEGNLNVSAPAIDLTTRELIEETETPLSILGWTHSCLESNTPCGECSGCVNRNNVLNELSDR
ncbi:7-cyano-7-deazaguanine synthase [Haloarcula marismortui]|uniref:7-cyano-7-deazaguanine synthase n=1 Tax=Haloarcula marismortui ATCC 33800 TaxID=662476 RepID=M0JPA3_9EURY|nr:7-cyano-7-deazaguanine synthase [Haloarcula sinaiiensis]EMA09809.1 ExsB family protein [Haloarcula sinaiiensis ATCC 33800]QUJ74719.1 7-cyano-7-deazaguanine synthase [Haloarcula sinaiiensis ATCC 33800]